MSITATASSGMRAAQQRLDAAAQNVARMQVQDAQRQRVTQTATPDGGVATQQRQEPGPPELAQELPEAKDASYAFQANLQVLRTHDAMLGTLLDVRA